MARFVLYLLILVVLTVGILCADSNDTTPSPATTPKTPSETDKPDVIKDVLNAATDIPKAIAATCRDVSQIV
ncbi:unnamed protein product [Euphydryas editha]|uniref:Uncharacterized protein n=1 Tax=Euphydryas editha TaxID=104508 RepID=A0AAU9TYA6_EUPED|nr:unnamed protein product [Euphydryas editha]